MALSPRSHSFRLRFLLIALLLSLFFLLLQFYALSTVLGGSSSSSSSFQEPSSSSSSPTPRPASKYAILDVIKSFIDLMIYLEVPVFVLDPSILQHLLVLNVDGVSRCKFFCDVPDGVVTFGVAATFWPDRKSALETLKTAGFKVHLLKVVDPRPAAAAAVDSTASSAPTGVIPTHLRLRRREFLVHLVFLHERSGNSFWFDRAAEKGKEILENDGAVSFKLRVGGDGAGSISRIETTRVNLDGIKVFVPKDPVRVLDELPSSTFIECDSTRASSFFSRFPRDVTDSGAAFRHLARKTLLTAGRVLDSLGIPFWISSGTLLGWFRQCDVITYSGDVDVGLFVHDYDARLIAEFQRAGLELVHLFGKTTDSFELSFRFGQMKLDLFFFYRQGEDLVWNGGTQARTGKKFKYLFQRFSLCWAEFLQLRVRVPCPTEPYIEANYGKRWMEPVKAWDWKKSPPNVRENGEWPPEDWDQVIQTFHVGD